MEPDDSPPDRNVLGEPLAPCSIAPMTGFYRTGDCRTGPEDVGAHTICAQVNEGFLLFSRSHGNDLSTPRPEFDFPGLKPGDRWCVVATRWLEAFVVGLAPQVVLEATHESVLDIVDLDVLKSYAVAAPPD